MSEWLHSNKEKASPFPNGIMHYVDICRSDNIIVYNTGYNGGNIMENINDWRRHFLIKFTDRRIMPTKGKKGKVFEHTHARHYKCKVMLKMRGGGVEMRRKQDSS